MRGSGATLDLPIRALRGQLRDGPQARGFMPNPDVSVTGAPEPGTKSAGPAVVGIGTSAGGLSALRAFFSHVPEESRIAWVVVVHLSPDQPSHLAEILQPHVRMPVQQVTRTTPLQPDRVYVIPPNRNLSAIDTHLRLSDLEEQRRERAPIDHFFRTLASTHDGHSVGVILTGTGSDGSLGVKAIKEKGGLTVVQDPREAEYDGMPQNAIATGLVDLVLPLDQIAGAVLRFAHTQPRLPLAEEEHLEREQRDLLQKVFAQLRARTGRDFDPYKRSTILRRIHRRMQMRQVEELTDYIELLRAEPDEVRALGDDLLITVTNFFRDPEVFDALAADVLPRLFEGREDGDTIRVWSVGCATGEEAYSLAILMLEEAARREVRPRLQIFASDLHERSLERARDGFYPGDIEVDVTEDRLSRFFHRDEGGYRIRQEVRELIVFAPHNLLNHPPFSRLDLIACRNMLIYLQRDAQKDVIELFHYALRPGGVLVLGSSETLEPSELFRVEHKGHCIFRRRTGASPKSRLPGFPRGLPHLSRSALPERGGEVPHGALHQRMVERYAPPSLLVTPDDKVAHLSDHAGRYLVQPSGEATLNVFRLAREELRVELRAALYAARQGDEARRSRPVRVLIEGEPRIVAIDALPAREPEEQGYVLVIFTEHGVADSGTAVAGPDREEAEEAADGHARELVAELELTRQRMQSILEEQEAQQEELRASNEELQSANEELRSTLEELETSKEELQSMNEELQTVNQENRHKVEEFAQLSSDLQNLLASTEIATLFLDRQMRILRVTPRAAELFNVRPADRGRPLSDLANRLHYDGLQDDALQVLRTLIPRECEIEDEQGRWYLTRVLPYRSGDDRIGGVVITLVEITGRRRAEEALQRSEERYRALVGLSAQIVWTTDACGRVTEDSLSWRAFTGQSLEAWLGEGWINAIHPEDRDQALAEWQRTVREEQPYDARFRLWHADSSTWRWTHVRAAPLRDAGEAIRGWVGMNADITEQQEAEAALRQAKEAAEQADRIKTDFLAVMSHELRTPLNGIIGYTDLMNAGVLGPMNDAQHRSLERVQTCSWHLVSIIDEILTHSRIEAGREQLVCEEVDVVSLVEEVIDIITPAAEAKRLALRLEGAVDPVTAWTDPGKVRQVLLNLIGNAVRFTAEGEVAVIVDVVDSDLVRVHVRDTGPGIAGGDQKRVFEPFTQLEPALTRKDSGTGLGLSIAQRFARLLGGEIGLRSAPGEGSTFTLSMPRRVAEP
jgi:two-component system, chemotaxis family, CheB/CheR fusion protein